MALFHQDVTLNSDFRDFDYLEQTKIYLDSACQTLRPQQVIEAMDRYYHEYNACGDRVKYEWGREVDEKILNTREHLLRFVGKSKREYTCAFTLNTTYGINLLLGQLPKDRYEQIVTSVAEHNSVFLPSILYARKLGLRRTVLRRQPDGALDYDPARLARSVVVVNTTSNVDGSELTNATTLADDVHRGDGILLIDGAQTAGHRAALLRNVDFDALCFSGHKMYGPSIGIIVVKKKLLQELEPTFIGGGTVSDVQLDSYTLLPDEPASRLEAGLQNFAGIVGLGEALRWLEGYRPQGKKPDDFEHSLAEALFGGLCSIPHLMLLNRTASPVVSLYSDKIDAHRLAIFLSAQGVMVRSGYFCCHYYLDSLKHLPPLLRLSLGLNNTLAQVERAVDIIRKIMKGVS